MLCANCLEYLPSVRAPWCRICGRPVADNRICSYCNENKHIDYGRAWLYFIPPVNTLIHQFKYRKKTRLASLLGHAMALTIQSDTWLKRADCIVPVPMHWIKRLRRGYNQSLLLARVTAKNTGIALSPVLRRVRHTRSQTRLNDARRRENVTGAFALAHHEVAGKRVVLIDDVMTTGATANECARVLKQAGAEKVYTCVAAITP
jgi:ComF family protein